MTETAYFAAGCFWGVESAFRAVRGVVATRVGYAGGRTETPDYEAVCTGATGHAETVEVVFDPRRLSYDRLLELFFELHDPTQLNRQGPDTGTQYRSAIFTTDAEQEAAAREAKTRLQAQLDGEGIVTTEIAPAGPFWPAEEYHQRYEEKRRRGA